MTSLTEPPWSSVVVCTKDRPASVKETVARVLQQAGAAPFEVIVVDDGSELPVVLDGLAGSSVARVSRNPHRGRSAARNHGADLASGSVLIFLDDDMRVGPDFVVTHERAHRRWDRALAVGPQVLPPASLRAPFGRFRERLERTGMPGAGGVVARPNFCTAANMSIPRRVFVELGGFNPLLHCAEDQDLALRHSARGWPIVFVPEAAALHDDLAADVRSHCRKAEWTGRHLVDFCRAQPAWFENQERLRVNGSPLPGREPVLMTARKIGKSLLGRAAPLQALFGLTALVERTIGDSRLLDALYTTLLGIHLQRGFRSGQAAGSQTGKGTGGAR